MDKLETKNTQPFVPCRRTASRKHAWYGFENRILAKRQKQTCATTNTQYSFWTHITCILIRVRGC